MRHRHAHHARAGAAMPIAGGEANVIDAAIAAAELLGPEFCGCGADAFAVGRRVALADRFILPDAGDGEGQGVALGIGGPADDNGTNLLLGGHSSAGLGAAAVQSGAWLSTVMRTLSWPLAPSTSVTVKVRS